MQRPEQEIQRAILKHLKIRGAPEIFYFHCPNGGYRRPIEAAVFKSLGAVPGIPDLIIIKAGKTYALELKTETGKLSDNQLTAMAAMSKCGVETAVAYGLDAAIGWLEERGILRGKLA